MERSGGVLTTPVEVIKSSPSNFVLFGHTENFQHDMPDFKEGYPLQILLQICDEAWIGMYTFHSKKGGKVGQWIDTIGTGGTLAVKILGLDVLSLYLEEKLSGNN